MKRLVVVLCLSLLVPATAYAGPILSGTINGVLFCAFDNNSLGACSGGGLVLLDIDPAVGSLQLANTTLGGVTVNGSTHTQTSGPIQDSLNSQSLQIINNTAGTINAEVSVGGIGYAYPVSLIQSSGSGTWQNAEGSTILMQWFADPANAQGGETFNDHPGILLASFADVAGIGVDSFALAGVNSPFIANAPFSMTTNFSMSLAAGGQLTSRGQTMIAQIQPIPEPASLVLLGTGLLSVVRYRLKRKK